VMPKDALNIRSNVSFRLGNQPIRKSQTVLTDLAKAIIDWIFSDSEQTTKPATTIDLYDDAGNYIKSLTGTWGTPTDTGSSWKKTITAEDTSSDEYSVKEIRLKTDDGAYVYLKHVESDPVSKPTDRKLTITWDVEVPYGS